MVLDGELVVISYVLWICVVPAISPIDVTEEDD